MSHDQIHLVEDFTLDIGRGCLLRDGEEVHLRPQSYEVLKYLAENQGHLISKDKLIEDVWQGRAVTDGSLGKCIEEVREALGENARQYVRNVRGRGYILDPEAGKYKKLATSAIQTEQIDLIRVVVEEETEGEDDQAASQPAALLVHAATSATTAKASAAHAASNAKYVVGSVKRHRRGALLVLATTVIAAAIAAFAYLKYFDGRSQAITSVAVLPFANASANQNLEYLSDGISENLINALSQLPQMKVIARNSAFEYKGKDADPQEVAKALGVQAILTGRVMQRGDDLVVSAELVDARDRTQVWGGQYSRKATDIQAIQEEIARTISEKLRLRLSGAQEQQLTKRATENTQSYQFYLNGLFNLRMGGFENVRRALDYFNQAVTLDPNFALPWVGVANANRYLTFHSLLDPKEPLAKAKAAAQKALELDETLAEAHVALAGIKQDEWEWAGAEHEYKRAIELNPNLAEAHNRYAQYLATMGRHTEALDENERAQELDPLRLGLRRQEASFLYLARRYDEALEKQQQAVKMESDFRYSHFNLGLMYAAKGMYEQAINEYQEFISIEGETTNSQIYLGYALAMSGKRSEAQAILDKLMRTKEYVSPAELAVLYVGLGDKEWAIASLEKAYAAHDIRLQYLKVDPYYDSLRSDPRFAALIRRMNLE
ncbi:MAG: winged helix-turn-helix domain-containing protein [Pyrinomonadaceae bacterium]|nr:winged helix-turn-helix domain-containing protein [Pyrinomonadaceae bacterium]